MTYSMTCSCGDVMTVQGNTRDEAVKNLKSLMNKEAVTEHMARKHAGESTYPGASARNDRARVESSSVKSVESIMIVLNPQTPVCGFFCEP